MTSATHPDCKEFFLLKKKGISQRVMEIKDSLLPTSVTYSGEFLSSDAKIVESFENPKDSGEIVGEGENLYDDTIRFSLDKDKGTVISPSKPSKAEVALRDAVIDRLRENGMEVITDVAEGQRGLDEADGRVGHVRS